MDEHEESLRSRFFEPPKKLRDGAHCSSITEYKRIYESSVKDPARFWGDVAKQFYWKSPPPGELVKYNFDFRNGPISIKWFDGALTNMCYNVLDRHVENGLRDTVCFYWEGNDPDDDGSITYGNLFKEVCKFANVLKKYGVKKGDRVAIYMPMILQLQVAMLSCARIGAVHSIVFGGFSSESLAERIMDSSCCLLITADGAYRGPKLLNLKEIADNALKICADRNHAVSASIVVRHVGPTPASMQNSEPASNTITSPPKRPSSQFKSNWVEGRDVWWHNEMEVASEECACEWLDAEDPLFMLYTSGSTGKPKGVLHTIGGYMLYTYLTFKYVFDYKPGDVYWCTADIGWITGHSYVVYGPMAAGATSVVFEGTPFYPDAGRFWQICDKYLVSKFYTAPTAIRALMKFGDEEVTKYSRSSLSVLGTVGEPINPEAWLWYHTIVGGGHCAVVDTFWQTETGGHTITPLPGCTVTKPGSATLPFFGVVPALMSEEGKELEGEAEGYLVFKQPWPGIMRTVYGDHSRFETTYFKKFPGYYTTGDGAKRDADGYYWITGRIDDMLNVSGHLLSTAEIESALVEHPSVVEAAVVTHPHPIKGECTYCFVTLMNGCEFTDLLSTDLKNTVRKKIGPFAQPDYIQNAPGLPKTRSGKIMRRVLRSIARNDDEFGDTSTLADPSVVDLLVKLRPPSSRDQ